MADKNNIIKTIKKIPSNILFCLIAIASFALFIFSVDRFFNSKKIGMEVGRITGEMAGKLIGSIQGLTDGLDNGAEAGEEAATSAEDTEVGVANRINDLGQLEVLSASVMFHDVLSEGGGDYKSLIAFYGDIQFTVDLYSAEISFKNNAYMIELPMPVANVSIDDAKSSILASYIEHDWSGTNEEGYNAFANSREELIENAEETVTNYDLLKDSAKESAKKQVSFLIQSATKEDVVIYVNFKE